jgi:hypothetical protein
MGGDINDVRQLLIHVTVTGRFDVNRLSRL